MKHLLYSVVAIAALTICAPVRAQPAMSTTPPAAYSGPSPRGETSAERAAPAHQAHHPHHMAVHPGRGPRPEVHAADQLNRQELSRLDRISPTPVNRMPAGGRVISGGTSR